MKSLICCLPLVEHSICSNNYKRYFIIFNLEVSNLNSYRDQLKIEMSYLILHLNKILVIHLQQITGTKEQQSTLPYLAIFQKKLKT
jgi:hypothetical protein